MDWNEIQNFLSNIVFGVLLFAMISYWINLSFFSEKSIFSTLGRANTIIANVLLFFMEWVYKSHPQNLKTAGQI